MYIIHLITDRRNRNISRKEKQEKEEEKKNFSKRGIDLVVRSYFFKDTHLRCYFYYFEYICKVSKEIVK